MHHIAGMAKTTEATRMSVTVTLPQKWWLKREAKRLGLTLGELIRRLIDVARDSK